MHFDWSTLILQTVNVLVLLWLLRRFLFRPVVAIIAERKNTAEKLLTDAASKMQSAQTQAEQTALHEKALASDGDRILADARASAQTERTTTLDAARLEADKMRAAAQAELETQRNQMRLDLDSQARQLAVAIASRLLGRVPRSAVDAALLEALDTTWSPDQWNGLAAAGETLEVVTASPLEAAMQAACTTMIQKRLGCSVQFATDPSLIAGVELRGPHARLHNNWRADLDSIAEELSHDDKTIVMA